MSQQPVLVTIFLRGAFDAINVVVPYADPDYAPRRRNIAIAPPEGSAAGLPIPVPFLGSSGQVCLDLDGYFGLHPSLGALEPLFAQGEMAPIIATGLPNADRSHFSAQLRMEVAGQSGQRVSGGWLGRALEATSAAGSQALRGIAIDTALDQSLAGSSAAAAVANSARYRLRTAQAEAWRVALAGLYSNVGEAFPQVQQRIFQALDLIAAAKPSNIPSDPNATYPANAFGNKLRQAAQYIKADMGLEMLTINSDGWDHHVNENGALPPLLQTLGDGLAALRTDLGSHWGRTVVLLMSEFGRTVNVNASGGTDHGRASMLMLLGGAIQGGQVYGRWPGLADSDLDPTGDLAVTTDYRQVLWEVLQGHLGISAAAQTHVFPGLRTAAKLGLMSS